MALVAALTTLFLLEDIARIARVAEAILPLVIVGAFGALALTWVQTIAGPVVASSVGSVSRSFMLPSSFVGLSFVGFASFRSLLCPVLSLLADGGSLLLHHKAKDRVLSCHREIILGILGVVAFPLGGKGIE